MNGTIGELLINESIKIFKNVKIPIIGVGGITNGEDAIEYMMAGATAVQIGTGIYYEGERIFTKIKDELKKWLNKNGYDSIKDIIGLALKK